MSAIPAIPAQVPRCDCPEFTDHEDCRLDAYWCDACGCSSDDPMPFYEHYGICHLYYCHKCGEEWIADGAAVLRVVGPSIEAK